MANETTKIDDYQKRFTAEYYSVIYVLSSISDCMDRHHHVINNMYKKINTVLTCMEGYLDTLTQRMAIEHIEVEKCEIASSVGYENKNDCIDDLVNLHATLRARCIKLNNMLNQYQNGTFDFEPKTPYRIYHKQYLFMQESMIAIDIIINDHMDEYCEYFAKKK